MDSCKKDFEKFCLGKFVDSDFNGQSSKITTREKGDKIIKLMKKYPVAVQYFSSFKHWVKQSNFQLVTSSACSRVI